MRCFDGFRYKNKNRRIKNSKLKKPFQNKRGFQDDLVLNRTAATLLKTASYKRFFIGILRLFPFHKKRFILEKGISQLQNVLYIR